MAERRRRTRQVRDTMKERNSRMEQDGPTKPPRSSADSGSSATPKGHPQDVQSALVRFLDALTELAQVTTNAIKEGDR